MFVFFTNYRCQNPSDRPDFNVSHIFHKLSVIKTGTDCDKWIVKSGHQPLCIPAAVSRIEVRAVKMNLSVLFGKCQSFWHYMTSRLRDVCGTVHWSECWNNFSQQLLVFSHCSSTDRHKITKKDRNKKWVWSNDGMKTWSAFDVTWWVHVLLLTYYKCSNVFETLERDRQKQMNWMIQDWLVLTDLLVQSQVTRLSDNIILILNTSMFTELTVEVYYFEAPTTVFW